MDGTAISLFDGISRCTARHLLTGRKTCGATGDALGFGNTIYDAANATAIGSDGGQCVRTVPGVSWECSWTTTLKNGQITVQGPFLDAGDSTLDARDANGCAYDFTFHVLG